MEASADSAFGKEIMDGKLEKLIEALNSFTP